MWRTFGDLCYLESVPGTFTKTDSNEESGETTNKKEFTVRGTWDSCYTTTVGEEAIERGREVKETMK